MRAQPGPRMADTRQVLWHHFQSLEHQKETSALGMWIFLVTEILFFGGMFVCYVVYRTAYPDAWLSGSATLDVRLGAINTAVLIGSSLTMALAVHAAQAGHRRLLVAMLLLTMALGGVFLGIKGVEYHHKWVESLIPGPGFDFHGHGAGVTGVQLFSALYFALTGMHALHMAIGMGLMANLVRQGTAGRFDAAYYTPVEMVGLYWHFVDIVWIFLFPLLYLLGRH